MFLCFVTAYKFYKKSDSGTSRQLFRFSLIHLPLLMLLLLLNKKRWFITETPELDALNPKKVKDVANKDFTGKNEESSSQLTSFKQILPLH